MKIETKELHTKEQALKGIIKGMQAVNDKVSPTMGAQGEHIVYEAMDNDPIVINDGWNIAKEIELENPLENLGARMVIRGMQRTANVAGDSTSLTCNLATNFVSEAHALIDIHNLNTVPFVRGMQYQINRTIDYVFDHAKAVESRVELYNAAFIASRDEEVSNLVVDAVEKSGENALIQIMKTFEPKSYLEEISGMSLELGLLTPQLLLPKDRETGRVELNEIKTLILKDKLIYARDTQMILSHFKLIADSYYETHSKKISFLIIAKEYSEEVINYLIQNKGSRKFMENINDIQLIMIPSRSQVDDMLMDLEAITNNYSVSNNYISQCSTDDLSKILGWLEELVIYPTHTIIKGDKSDEVKKKVEDRISILTERLKDKDVTKSDAAEDNLKNRIAKLSGGINIIRLAYTTKIEYDDLLERVDDALRTAKSSKESGVVPGGGNVLKACSKYYYPELNEVDILEIDDVNDRSYAFGRYTINKGILKPFKTICENGGIDNPFEYFKDVNENHELENSPNIGINISTWELVDLFKEGIIDSASSIAAALSFGGKTATMTLRIGGAITTKR